MQAGAAACRQARQALDLRDPAVFVDHCETIKHARKPQWLEVECWNLVVGDDPWMSFSGSEFGFRSFSAHGSSHRTDLGGVRVTPPPRHLTVMTRGVGGLENAQCPGIAPL
jgi:hypothetical protein